jgi:hypothetical protein
VTGASVTYRVSVDVGSFPVHTLEGEMPPHLGVKSLDVV